jgi:hypothetical protein
LFSKKAVQKTTKYYLKSTTPIAIINSMTWHMMRKRLFATDWFGRQGVVNNSGLLYYSLPNDIGLPGHSEHDICKEFNSVLDMLDVSPVSFRLFS